MDEDHFHSGNLRGVEQKSRKSFGQPGERPDTPIPTKSESMRTENGSILPENSFQCYCANMVFADIPLPIRLDHRKIEAFCDSKGISRLSLFGSVLRDDFDLSSSDVDVLAEFLPGALEGVGLDYFGYGDELSGIIGRKVDFCSKLNKYILPKVRNEMLTIYERA